METPEIVPQIASALVENLSDDERAELDAAITPRVAALFAKAFGDGMWDILVPLTEDDMPDAAPEETEHNGQFSADAGEARLRALMRDPRYWRDRDPNFVDKVAGGFSRLFPG